MTHYRFVDDGSAAKIKARARLKAYRPRKGMRLGLLASDDSIIVDGLPAFAVNGPRSGFRIFNSTPTCIRILVDNSVAIRDYCGILSRNYDPFEN